MAEPVPFAQANKILGPAKGTEDRVLELPVFCDDQQCVSCWQFTRPELDEIMRTGRVFVHVLSGTSQPPVMVSVSPPQ